MCSGDNESIEYESIVYSASENGRQTSIYRYISFNRWSEYEKLYW
jgi:hypothetical protein